MEFFRNLRKKQIDPLNPLEVMTAMEESFSVGREERFAKAIEEDNRRRREAFAQAEKRDAEEIRRLQEKIASLQKQRDVKNRQYALEQEKAAQRKLSPAEQLIRNHEARMRERKNLK